nr:uncharacterized protein LOC121468632 [Taeniopygia guttata]
MAPASHPSFPNSSFFGGKTLGFGAVGTSWGRGDSKDSLGTEVPGMWHRNSRDLAQKFPGFGTEIPGIWHRNSQDLVAFPRFLEGDPWALQGQEEIPEQDFNGIFGDFSGISQCWVTQDPLCLPVKEIPERDFNGIFGDFSGISPGQVTQGLLFVPMKAIPEVDFSGIFWDFSGISRGQVTQGPLCLPMKEIPEGDISGISRDPSGPVTQGRARPRLAQACAGLAPAKVPAPPRSRPGTSPQPPQNRDLPGNPAGMGLPRTGICPGTLLGSAHPKLGSAREPCWDQPDQNQDLPAQNRDLPGNPAGICPPKTGICPPKTGICPGTLLGWLWGRIPGMERAGICREEIPDPKMRPQEQIVGWSRPSTADHCSGGCGIGVPGG